PGQGERGDRAGHRRPGRHRGRRRRSRVADRDGGDPGRHRSGEIAQLPVTDGMVNEAIMHRAHRNGYDHGVRAAGARIVDIGYGGSTLPYQLRAAINERTALVVYLMSPWANQGALSLVQTCEIAHEANIPVLADAAA